MDTPAITERWLDVDGTRTRYLAGGAGEPVVFIHGGYAGSPWNVDSADVWDMNLAELAGKYHCIAPDRLGQGLTDNPKDDSGYAAAASVAHLIAFTEKLASGPVHLVGHSDGAFIAAQITQQRPDLVKSCTLASSSVAAPGSGRNEFVHALCPHPAFTLDRARFVLERISFGTGHITPAWLDRQRSVLDSAKHRAAGHAMIERGLFETRYINALRSAREAMFAELEHQAFRRAVMLFWGFNDPVAPIGQGYDLYALLARHQLRCQMHVVNDAGHYAIRERPCEFSRVLANFIEDVGHGV
jgi:2-hydroxy-6-oxo-6-(2'-carboxyphenyl)-hexa-2,4-dienoate hydrolase